MCRGVPKSLPQLNWRSPSVILYAHRCWAPTASIHLSGRGPHPSGSTVVLSAVSFAHPPPRSLVRRLSVVRPPAETLESDRQARQRGFVSGLVSLHLTRPYMGTEPVVERSFIGRTSDLPDYKPTL